MSCKLKTNLSLLMLGLLLWFSNQNAVASHIMGGEFIMEHQSDFSYRVTLSLYFNGILGAAAAVDNSVVVGIYSKKNNRLVESVVLPNTIKSSLTYSNIKCGKGSQGTILYVYSLLRNFDPAKYNEPEGYYMSWERCCRNDGVVNIEGPDATGMTFYMEFPAVVDAQGNPLINSSPIINKPASDKLCRTEEYVYSFKATDADNDSLVYSLVQPLAGNASTTSPIVPPTAAPYAPVKFSPGYTINNMISGTPPLSINSQTGEIRVAPNRVGMYIFGVRCEEFRNGKKIGEVRREMQYIVLNCVSNAAPSVSFKMNGSSVPYQPGDTLVFSDPNDFCGTVYFTDPDKGKRLRLKVESAASQPQPALSVMHGFAADTALTSELCWQSCESYDVNKVYKSLLIVEDDGCPKPKADTVVLVYKFNLQANMPPVLQVYKDGMRYEQDKFELKVGEPLTFVAIATDPDKNKLILSLNGKGFNLSEVGMAFTVTNKADTTFGLFSWTPACSQLNQNEPYELLLQVSDINCYSTQNVTRTLQVSVKDNPFADNRFLPPTIFTPNNDGINDLFELTELPTDNCSNYFKEIKIYNRWGSMVFSSDKRSFKWNGQNVSDGVYYYHILFSEKAYKGTVTITR